MLKQSLTNQGFTGRLCAEVMPWFNGDGKHPTPGYLSQSPWVVGQQLDAMKALGIEEVCVTYSGSKVSPLAHAATVEMAYQCGVKGIKFSLLLNASMVASRPDTTIAPTTEVINRLTESDTIYLMSCLAYLPERIIYEFDLAPNGVNLGQVSAAIPPGYTLASKHTGYTWPEKSNMLTTLSNDLTSNKGVGKCVIFRSFNDGNPTDLNKSVWDITKPVTLWDPMAGQLWYSQLSIIKPRRPDVKISVMWNDYQEQKDGCWEPTASVLSGIRIG